MFHKSILQEAIQGRLVPQHLEEGTAQNLLEQIKSEKQKLIKEGRIKKSALVNSTIYKGDDNKYYEQDNKYVQCIDDEIPFDIPNSWCWTKLKNIGTTQTGTTPTKSHHEYFGDFLPFYGPGNIQENKLQPTTQGISQKGLPFSRIVPSNSILQVCIGGSIGKAAITNGKASFNQQINSITTYKSLDTKYIFYVMTTEMFYQQIINKATGTATPIINRTNWENLYIPIPPYKEQQRIVECVEKITSIMSR